MLFPALNSACGVFQVLLDQFAAERAGHLSVGNVYFSMGTVFVFFFVFFFGQHCQGAGVDGIQGSGIMGPRPNGTRTRWDWMDYYFTSRARIALHVSNSEGGGGKSIKGDGWRDSFYVANLYLLTQPLSFSSALA